MWLFSTKQSFMPYQDPDLHLTGPFFTITSSLEINTKKLSEISIKAAFKTSNDTAYIFTWEVDGCIIECLKIALPFSTDLNIDSIHLWAYVWRVQNGSQNSQIKFFCRTEFNTPSCEGSIETGESLIAKTWEQLKSALSIGTEDHEALFSRAGNEWMPARFFKTDWPTSQSPLSIQPLTNGFFIMPPELKNDEKLQVQFLCSWAHGKDAKIATWYAVDRSYDKISLPCSSSGPSFSCNDGSLQERHFSKAPPAKAESALFERQQHKREGSISTCDKRSRHNEPSNQASSGQNCETRP
jgi:hypothetical protein